MKNRSFRSLGSASTVTYDSTNSSRNSWVSGTTRRDTIVSRKLECAVHVWSPSPHHHRRKSIKPRGVICAFHGIPGHFQSPTDKYLPELLSQYNYVVYGMEIPGYGKSQSRKGSSANDIIQHGINLALYAHVKHSTLPMFFAGTGTGGTIALLVSNAVQELAKSSMKVSGIILLEPSIGMQNVDCVSTRLFSSKVSSFIPSTPSLRNLCGESHQNYLLEEEQEEKLLAHSPKHLKKANQTMIQITAMLRKSIHDISLPFICLGARDDANFRNEGIKDLMFMTASTDKKLYQYKNEIDNFRVPEANLANISCSCSASVGNSALYNYNANAMRHEHQKLDSSHPNERLEMEDDLITWLHARTIGVQHFKRVSSLLRSDSQARRNSVIDDLEDALFS